MYFSGLFVSPVMLEDVEQASGISTETNADDYIPQDLRQLCEELIPGEIATKDFVNAYRYLKDNVVYDLSNWIIIILMTFHCY